MPLQTPTRHFELLNAANHPVIPMEGLRVCLDTGSPFTFKHPLSPAQVRLMDRDLTLPEIPGPRSAMEAADRLLGFQFDVLMGMDLMSGLSWRLDWRTGTAEAAPTLLDEPGTTWLDLPPILPGLAVACPSFRVNNGAEVALLDTGAHLSYCVGQFPATARQVGQTQDFNPHLGVFATPIWEDALEIGGHSVPIRFGRLPQQGAMMLQAMGASWILGSDLLRAFRMTLDLPAARLGLRPQPEAA